MHPWIANSNPRTTFGAMIPSAPTGSHSVIRSRVSLIGTSPVANIIPTIRLRELVPTGVVIALALFGHNW